MKRYLPFAIIAVVLVLAAGGGALFYRFKQQQIAAAREAAAAATRQSALSVKRGADPPHVRGPADAGVVLEEFGDFECPPCGNISPIIEKLKSDYGNRLRVVFREFPMAVHTRALRAACAAEAAGLQGKFWEMHDLLFQERFIWPKAPDVERLFGEYGGRLQLDVNRFTRDIDSEEVKRRIMADQERGASLHVDRTPTLFLNGQLVPTTSFNPEGLRNLVEAELKERPR
jgi:protein-disulfide isomerase